MKKINKKSKRLNQESGLTLIEIMCSCAILVGGLVMMFGSVFTISEASTISEERVKALSEISSVMEEIRNMSPTELQEYYPPYETSLGSYSMIMLQAYSEEGYPVYFPMYEGMYGEEMGINIPNPCEVEVTIWWMNSKGRFMQQTASTMIGR